MRKVAPTQRHFKDSSFDFSRQRSLWRGTRPSGEVEWWALSDTSCSSRIQRGPQRFSGA